MEPKYLGDGVYVKFDGYHVVVMTGSHVRPSNTVYLEDGVALALVDYIKEAFEMSFKKSDERES